MLIGKMAYDKAKLNAGNIQNIVSLEELFYNNNNSYLKEVLKRYNEQSLSMDIRIFIQDKIDQYQRERYRQLYAENENQALSYKLNADNLLKHILRFMKFAQREHINMQTATNNLIFVQDEFYIKHCVNLNVEPTEIMPKSMYNDLLTLCDGNHASNVIYLYPFFRDTKCINKYVEYNESQQKEFVIPEWEIDILLSIRKSIQENPNGNYLEEEQCLSGQDLHHFYVKMRESIFNHFSNKNLIEILKNPELSFIITEGDIRAKIEKLINKENFELIYAILKHFSTESKIDEKFIKKLDEYQISTIMKHAVNDENTTISTNLFLSSKVAQQNPKEYFELLKELKDYKNMFKMLVNIKKTNTIAKGFNNKITTKYDKILNEFYTYINEQADQISKYILNNFTRDQFNDYYDMIEFLFFTRTMDSNNENFNKILDSFGIDFLNMPDQN